jgi:hypothetical protein
MFWCRFLHTDESLLKGNLCDPGFDEVLPPPLRLHSYSQRVTRAVAYEMCHSLNKVGIYQRDQKDSSMKYTEQKKKRRKLSQAIRMDQFPGTSYSAYFWVLK